MSMSISVIDRATKALRIEKVWGGGMIDLLYGDSWSSKTLGRFLLMTLFRWPALSSIVGLFYNTRYSRRWIKPFCEKFEINVDECSLPLSEYKSFGDFFTRTLHPLCRVQDAHPDSVTMPADGRYRFLQHLEFETQLPAKGEELNLEKLLQNHRLAAKYHGGIAILCRLCPADCHRFFFPCDGIASDPRFIHGSLFSVNPCATNRYPWILWTNRRVVTTIQTEKMGTVCYVEIGATNCGSIVQEYTPRSYVRKGQEKGYFQLGASAIILLFERGTIHLEEDLVALSAHGGEVLCQTGQRLAFVGSAVDE